MVYNLLLKRKKRVNATAAFLAFVLIYISIFASTHHHLSGIDDENCCHQGARLSEIIDDTEECPFKTLIDTESGKISAPAFIIVNRFSFLYTLEIPPLQFISRDLIIHGFARAPPSSI